MTWDENLTGSAYEIAASKASPLRVTAGPGVGKTFALMRRVARLLTEKVNPKRILVCTFTRTAAADLANELSNLKMDGSDKVIAGTLHSFCFGMLAKEDVLALTGRVPRPLMDFEQRFLLEDLNDSTFGNVRKRTKRLAAFNAAWARLQSEDPGWPLDEIDKRFLKWLRSWLLFHRCMLIGELIPEGLKYLSSNPESAHLTKFSHVMVDEYQDLNKAEQSLLDLLASNGKLLIVGDEDQSIYSFKYAHPEGISEFSDTHPGTHDLSLDKCRRCPTLVVEMANHLIQTNELRSDRKLETQKGNPRGEVFLVQWKSLKEESEGLARFIAERVNSESVAPGKLLVLAHRRKIGYALREALAEQQISAHSFFNEEALDGDPKKPQESQAQQAYSLLSLLADPDDVVSLRCWCGFGSPSLRSGAWSRLRGLCGKESSSPKDLLDKASRGLVELKQCKELVIRYQELQKRIESLKDLAGHVLVDSLFPEGEEWAKPFRDIASVDEHEESTIDELRDSIRSAITQPELPTDVDYVRIMSLHKSKGLTAEMVIVAGCIEGVLPKIDSEQTADEQQRSLEEQRRLFYVAITRPTKTLLLSSITSLPTKLAFALGAKVGRHFGGSVSTIASSFWSELGPTCPKAVSGSRFLASQGIDTQ